MKKLFLVDAYALIFKYYYAFLGRPMRNRAGMNTSVVFGFVKFLRDIQKRERPDLLGVAFIIGISRGITVIMNAGMITDTIVHGLVGLLSGTGTYVAAYGMVIIENIVKLFINGSTSAATITMPILAPAAELVGMSRSIAVLAYQLGHSFADIFWPTACALCCGLMGVPINKWYKFITPLFGILFVMEFVFITAAVFIGY